MILALAPVDSFPLGLTFVFDLSSSDSVVATSLLCNSLLVALLEEEVVIRVSNGKGAILLFMHRI